MADPGTLALGSMAISGGGTLLKMFGDISGGEASANMYAYKAGVAKINEQIAKSNADYARKVGEVEAQQSGMQTRFQIGGTKVTQASSGLDVNRGSTVDVRESESEVGQENQAIIRSNAARKAYGYEVEGAKASAEGTIASMAGSESRKAGLISAAGSLLSGGASVASKWMQYKTNFGDSPTSPGPYEAPIENV